MEPPPEDLRRSFARTAFATALGWLVIAAGLGAWLRLQAVYPLSGCNYQHLLHAHSHLAFLGFAFNGLLALLVANFAPEREWPALRRLFPWLQVAVAGMAVAFPLQGYGPVSIAFSSLHMAGAGWVAWRLWRRAEAGPASRGHLRAALAWMALSGLGPLALGPLAALGLRDAPAYTLAVYFYLHAQYNGWFLFALQALMLRDAGAEGEACAAARSRRALRWFTAGTVLTLAQSALWLDPPHWVRAAAALGGVCLLLGVANLWPLLRGWCRSLPRVPRCLVRLAAASYALKVALQLAAAWPGLSGWVNHRWMVIAFLHLVFLGVLVPALFAGALTRGWLRLGAISSLGLALLLGGGAATGLLLVAPVLGWPCAALWPWLLATLAAAMWMGALFLLGGLRRGERGAA